MSDEYEKFLHLQLSALREAYAREAQPIIDRLVHIESLRTRPMLIPQEECLSILNLRAELKGE